MSQRATPSLFPSIDLGNPRWSVKIFTPKLSWQPRGSPASIAGLPGSSACVWVGPPLFCSGPSLGSAKGGNGGPSTVQFTTPSRLLLCEVILPEQFPSVATHTLNL